MSILEDLVELLGPPEAAIVGPIPRAPAAEASGPAPDGPMPLRGMRLRYALSLELFREGELTVAALIDRLGRAGYCVVGRPSKAVSDALRWEIGHGRVVRVARGRYRTGRIPRSTRWWMSRFLERVSEAWRDESPARREQWSQPVPRATSPLGNASAWTALRRRQREHRRRRALAGLPTSMAWPTSPPTSPPITT